MLAGLGMAAAGALAANADHQRRSYLLAARTLRQPRRTCYVSSLVTCSARRCDVLVAARRSSQRVRAIATVPGPDHVRRIQLRAEGMDGVGRQAPGDQYESSPVRLLGTTYGGNGQTTFAIPDMRGRVVISNGQGPGLNNRILGEASGSEQVTLSTAQLPMHAHLVTPQGSPSDASLQSPADAVPATKARTTLYAPPSPTPVPMSPVVTSTAGSSAPVSLIRTSR